MIKLLAFMGTGRYEETVYHWLDATGREQTCTSAYASVASRQCCGAESVTVFATAQAEEKHRQPLDLALADCARLIWVPIPAGETEAALWEIYSAIEDSVQAGDRIALDVTHGFRSLPVVAIMAATFLAASRRVVVERILYGAWDARDKSCSPPRTPLFDLTPMFSLLDWATAADRFASQGDARMLGDLLRDAKPSYLEQRADSALRGLSKDMSQLATTLQEISGNLLVNRPHSAMVAAERLTARLPVMERLPPPARPLAGLIRRVQETFGWLSLSRPLDPVHARDNLERQRRLARWYYDHGHYLQAITLAREWMVSWRLVHRGAGALMDREAREAAAAELGCLQVAQRAGLPATIRLSGVPEGLDAGDMWNRVTKLRNDLAHLNDIPGRAGGELGTDSLIRRIAAVIAEIDRLEFPPQAGAAEEPVP